MANNKVKAKEGKEEVAKPVAAKKKEVASKNDCVVTFKTGVKINCDKTLALIYKNRKSDIVDNIKGL